MGGQAAGVVPLMDQSLDDLPTAGQTRLLQDRGPLNRLGYLIGSLLRFGTDAVGNSPRPARGR